MSEPPTYDLAILKQRTLEMLSEYMERGWSLGEVDCLIELQLLDEQMKDEERKKYPVGSGFLDYFPDAAMEVARVSYEATQQHHPGEPMHWDREKSTDESDAMIRHFLRRYEVDTDGMLHAAKMAWRSMAFLQKLLESRRETK